MKGNDMEIGNTIKYAILVVAVLVGIGVKVYFGDTQTSEMIDEGIEVVVKDEVGVDLKPVFSGTMESAVSTATPV